MKLKNKELFKFSRYNSQIATTCQNKVINKSKYSASRLQGPLFQFFTKAFVLFCRMGTVGDVKLKVCIHVDKSFLIVCV